MAKLRIKSPVSFGIFFVILTLSSCNNWLSVAPENDLIKEKFWAKREDVDGALAATYNAIRDASLQSLLFGEVRADLVTLTGTSFSGYGSIAGSNITPSNDVIKWNNYYSAINLANTLMYYDKLVLEKDKTFTQKMKDAVDAEALFIRSLCYFYLVRIWKEVPLVLEPSISDTSNLFLPKSPENVIISQIIKDLLIAKDMAYTTEFQGSDYFYGRANKYAIMTLLADVYLWDEQYEKCIEYCDLVSNSGLYGLEPYPTWFNLYNPGNSAVESIFEIQYNDNLESQENPIYYNLIPVTGNPQLALSKNVLTLMNKDDDLRYCEANTPIWKYLGKDINGTVKRSSNERDAHWIIYRYADIILMKAEAETELGNFGAANALVRQTSERAGMPYVDAVNKDDMRKAVLDEKGREFIIEGKRWFDILRAAKRNNFLNKQIIITMILSGADVQKQAILKTKVYDPMSYYLPIPEHEILFNQNLIQNPFYDR
jgi:hypothetical protein